MLLNTCDGLLIGEATFLKSLIADQGLTKRRAQTLVKQERDKTKLS